MSPTFCMLNDGSDSTELNRVKISALTTQRFYVTCVRMTNVRVYECAYVPVSFAGEISYVPGDLTAQRYQRR